MYVLSCWKCSTEYQFKKRAEVREFGRICPFCEEPLSPIPLPRYKLTPPPNMIQTERKIKIVRTWEDEPRTGKPDKKSRKGQAPKFILKRIWR